MGQRGRGRRGVPRKGLVLASLKRETKARAPSRPQSIGTGAGGVEIIGISSTPPAGGTYPDSRYANSTANTDQTDHTGHTERKALPSYIIQKPGSANLVNLKKRLRYLQTQQARAKPSPAPTPATIATTVSTDISRSPAAVGREGSEEDSEGDSVGESEEEREQGLKEEREERGGKAKGGGAGRARALDALWKQAVDKVRGYRDRDSEAGLQHRIERKERQLQERRQKQNDRQFYEDDQAERERKRLEKADRQAKRRNPKYRPPPRVREKKPKKRKAAGEVGPADGKPAGGKGGQGKAVGARQGKVQAPRKVQAASKQVKQAKPGKGRAVKAKGKR